MSEEVTYASGAKRSATYPRFRDVPYELLEAIAKAFAEGAAKYEKPEEGWLPYQKNWKRGDIAFALDAADHALRHLNLYANILHARLNGESIPAEWEPDDNHLGNCGANLGMLAWFERNGMFERDVPLETEGEAEYEPVFIDDVQEESEPVGVLTVSSRIKQALGIS